MRYVSVLASCLILVASALGQQTPAPSADQPPAHPITAAQVHELLELTGANRLRDEMMSSTLGYLRTSFPPYVPKDVIDDLQASLQRIDLEPTALKAYQMHVSTEDAAQVIAFYKTAAGRRVIAVMPLIARQMQVSATIDATQVARQVVERHKDEIKAAALRYQQEHSDAPTITSPN
jgi:hypothetical protein